jgi:twitching motility protein PilU
VGTDTLDWGQALKNALRQAPDVVVLGELRGLDSAEQAMAFAETGHLVMATLHASNTNQAIDRILSFFPEYRRDQLLLDLSLNLRAVVSQRLLPRLGRSGRVPAVEILINTPLVADLIRKGQITAIRELMGAGRADGMQTFDQILFDLHEAGTISLEEALRNADSMNDLRLQIKLRSQRAGITGPSAGIDRLSIL